MNTKVKSSKLKLCVLAVLLSISLVLGTFRVYAEDSDEPKVAKDENGNSWTYNLVTDEDGNEENKVSKIRLSSLSKNGLEDGILHIPGTIAGKEVVSIGDGNNTIFSSLKSNSDTESIDELKNSIKVIEIADSITEINKNAFNGTTSLTSVEFGRGITTIGDYAFNGCTGIENLHLPNSLETIGKNAFNGCTGLNSLTLSENLENIEMGAFTNCTKITGDLSFPNSLKTIGASAFQNCSGLNGEITFGTNLISIGEYAFQNCVNIHKLILPKSDISVGASAFSGLKDIWIDATKEECSSDLNSNCFGINKGYEHYKDEKISVNFKTLEGIEVIDADTEKEFTSGDFQCEESLNLKFRIKSRSNYNNLKLFVEKESEYKYENLENKEYDEIKFVNGEATYKIDRLLRDYEFLTLDVTDDLDLAVRTYLYQIDGKDIEQKLEREPHYELNNCEITYKHSKQPITVKTGDTLVYKIRVYNEGKQGAYAKKILEYLPEGLEFKKDSKTNKQYGWVPQKDNSSIIATDYLKNKEIDGFEAFKDAKYQELEIELTVTAEKEKEVLRLTNFVEIGEACTVGENSCTEDIDSVFGNLNVEEYSSYKKEECNSSSSESFIECEEDDTDLENVVILREVPVSYTLRISKTDLKEDILLNGAKFDLLSENGEILQSGVTVENGTLTFDTITTYGNGNDIYYISETESPEGYINSFGQVIKITVIKTILDESNESYSLQIICDVLETKIDTRVDENTLVPIYNEDQLKKVGTGDTETINGIEYTLSETNDYRLMNDIDLSDEEWIPLPNIEGIFDGNGHKITGLKITGNDNLQLSEDESKEKDEDTDNKVKNAGLFTELSGIITNLELEKVNIDIELTDEDKNNVDELEKELQQEKEKTSRNQKTIDDLEEKIEAIVSKYHIGGFVGTMKGGSINNSSISGKVQTDSDNVGGFVGYAEKGYLTKIVDSTNSATIKAEYSNAGGFIGCSYSALSLVDCSNEANVNAQKYNSAGLVGYSEAKEYKTEEKNVEYDDKNHIIDLVIGNSQYTGKYSLKLKKIDNLSKELIDGTIFTVYDGNQNPLESLTSVKVENGVLDIGTFDIKATGVDTYFIKEESTVDGYELLKDYIRVNVIKTWDGKEEDFKVHLDSVNVDTEDFEKNEDEAEEIPNSRTTGNYDYDEGKHDKVSWLANKVVATGCTNNGEISAKVNASGLFAKTKCIVDIENSSNTGAITSKNHSAGLVSESLKVDGEDSSTEIIINNSSNSGNIFTEEVKIVTYGQYSDPTTIGQNGAGIIADTEVLTIIKQTENLGEVSGFAQTLAGFIASSKDNIIIDECSNTADIKVDTTSRTSSDYVAGIVGKNYTPKTTIDITNTYNTGDITSTSSASGILGIAVGDKIRISDCNTSNCKIDGNGSISGIIAFSAGDTYVNGCSTTSIEINNKNSSSSPTSAILGLACDLNISTSNGYQQSSPTIIDVEDCIVEKIQITGLSNEIGGIVGKITVNNVIDKLKFKNCKIEDSNINNTSSLQKAGMLFGIARNFKALEVDNCDVIESNIKSNTSSCQDISTLMGIAMNSTSVSDGTYININDCDIDTSKIEISRAGTVGNIVGFIYGSNNKTPITISNCSVNNSPLSMNSCNSIGNVVGMLYSTEDIELVNCEVNNSPVDISSGPAFTSSAIGFAYTNGSITSKNIDITNSSALSTSGNGGILIGGCNKSGYSSTTDNSVNFENCTLTDNSMICGNKDGYTSTYCVGLLVGLNGLGPINIRDIIVKTEGTENKNELYGCQAGLVGYSSSNVDVDNLYLDNYKFSFKGSSSRIGGVVGVSSGAINIKNSNISNLDFDVPQCSASLVSYSNGDISIDNVDVNNINILCSGSYDFVGGVVCIANKKLDITDSTFDKINIDCTIGSIVTSGIAGLCSSDCNISNNTISNITVNNENQNQYYVAGVLGIHSSGKVTLANNKFSDFDLTGKKDIGGVIGCCANLDTISNENSKNILNNFNLISEGMNANGIGGLVGISSGNSNKIHDIEMNSIDIKSVAPTVRVGGIAGVGGLDLENCNINDLTINNQSNNNSTYPMSGSFIGSVAGVNTNSSSDSHHLVVEDSNITATCGYVGGLFGYTAGPISDVVFMNGNINSSGYVYTGGIAGFAGSNTSNNSDLNVEGTNIIGNSGCAGGIFGNSCTNISGAWIEGCEVKLKDKTGTVGGIVGSDCSNSITILESNVENSTITNVSLEPTNKATIATIYPAGGIVGYSSGLIKDCNVTNTTIESTGENAYATGGIVGHGYNYALSTGSKIYTKVQDCNVTDCTIKGADGVGGIAGVAVPEISGCIVEGTETESNTESAEIQLEEVNSQQNVETQKAESNSEPQETKVPETQKAKESEEVNTQTSAPSVEEPKTEVKDEVVDKSEEKDTEAVEETKDEAKENETEENSESKGEEEQLVDSDNEITEGSNSEVLDDITTETQEIDITTQSIANTEILEATDTLENDIVDTNETTEGTLEDTSKETEENPNEESKDIDEKEESNNQTEKDEANDKVDNEDDTSSEANTENNEEIQDTTKDESQDTTKEDDEALDSSKEETQNKDEVQEKEKSEEVKQELIPQSNVVNEYIRNDSLLSAITDPIESIAPNVFVETLVQEEKKESEVEGTECVGGIEGCGGILFTPYMKPLTITNCKVINTKVEGKNEVDGIVGKGSEVKEDLQLPPGTELKDTIEECKDDNCEIIPSKKENP